MQKFKYVLYLLSAVLIMGCGQNVVETLYVPDPPIPNAPGKGLTVVILPFADYTDANSLAGAHRRNLSISEAITDRLVSNGFGMAIDEDVFGYLVKEDIINILPYDRNNSPTLSDELNNEWTPEMKGLLQNYIDSQALDSGTSVSKSPGTHALTQEAIAKIGRKFNADYIIRGRILEYRTREAHTWVPWKKGILPFAFGLSSQTINGFARSDQYDTYGHMVLPATIGAVVGYNVETFGTSAGSTVMWGAVGIAAGQLAKNGGQVDEAVVQMRIYVQEAATGNLVWTNRVDVKVSPDSVYADRSYDMLFDAAISKGVNTLIDNFVAYGL